jgi:ABC-type transporter Mla MlaB component
MLKITRVESLNKEITLQLDGSVTGQWVALLREYAGAALKEGRRLRLDLENISFIDCEGLAVIKSLIDCGVEQMNAPLFVAEQIKKCGA